MRRRAQRANPKQHPDPVVERDLDRIRQLRRRARVKTEQIDDYRVEIDSLHEALRRHTKKLAEGSPYVRSDSISAAIEADGDRATQLQGEIRALEQDIDHVHDELESRMDKLNPSDLAYL